MREDTSGRLKYNKGVQTQVEKKHANQKEY